MATQVQLRRGTAAQNDAFTGAPGEVTYDSDNDTLRVHDGATAGGYKLARLDGNLTFTGDIKLGDNDKAIFGAGSDLQIYSDGTNSWIEEHGGGDLYIEATNLTLRALDNTVYATFADAGASTIYHAGAQKFQTTATGVDVTGTVTADGLTVDGNAPQIQINQANPILIFTEQDQAADSQKWGIQSENSLFKFRAFNDALSSAVTGLSISRGGDISFYEDTGTTPKFFWDASAETLTLGASSGNTNVLRVVQSLDGTSSRGLSVEATTGHEFGIYRDANSDGAAHLRNNGIDTVALKGGNVGIGTSSPVSDAKLTISDTSSPHIYFQRSSAGAGDAAIGMPSSAALAFYTPADQSSVSGLSEAMRIDSSGNVGIGTSSPSHKLHVSGTGSVSSRTFATDAGGDASFFAGNDNGQIVGPLVYGSGKAAYGALGTSETALYSNRQLTIMSDNASGIIKFATGGNTERMRIDASGNLLVGTTSSTGGITATTGSGFVYRPTKELTVHRQGVGASSPVAIFNQTGDDGQILDLRKDGTTVGSIGASGGKLQVSGTGNNASLIFDHANTRIEPYTSATTDLGRSAATFKDLYLSGGLRGDITFKNNAGTTEYARFDASGNLLLGRTSSSGVDTDGHVLWGSGISYQSATSNSAQFINRNGTDGAITTFYKNGTPVGSISVTASATAYNTSSDYRLKEDVQPMVGASDRVMSLNPVNFAWKSDGTRTDGFLAHEAQAVVPEAVTGEKDGEEMQAIDHSKLVPLLTAALQEALGRIETLEAEVAALKA